MRITHLFCVATICFASGLLQAQATRPATQSAVDADSDPRPNLSHFFDAIRNGDESAAFDLWYDDIPGDDDHRKHVESLVHHLDAELAAEAKFQTAMSQKMPVELEKMRKQGSILPDSKTILGCQFTAYRRLAICKWGEDEDDGFPMVLDNHGKYQGIPEAWRISMQQWYETNKSSVGDSMLLSGWGAKAKDLTTKDLLAGKLKTMDDVEGAYIDHMKEISDAEDNVAATRPLKKTD